MQNRGFWLRWALWGASCLGCERALGQSNDAFGFRAETGFLILHSEAIAPIGSAAPWGVGIDYARELDPDVHYPNCLCFPRMGFSLSYHNLDKPGILGSSFPLYGFLEPHYRLSGPWFFHLRGGMGFAYQTTPYDLETNPLNLSYSLYLNTFVQLGAGVSYRPEAHWSASLSALYNHSSNGGIQEPNKGLNYPTLALGVEYSLKPRVFKSKTELNTSPPPPKRLWTLEAFAAGKAIDETRVTYAVYGLEASYLYQFSRVSAWDAGIELLRNAAYEQVLDNAGTPSNHFEASLLAGHAFVMGKFTFSQQAGVYLYRDYAPTPDWFQRYGVNYYFWKNLSLGANIRVHGHVAEFLDVRLGWGF